MPNGASGVLNVVKVLEAVGDVRKVRELPSRAAMLQDIQQGAWAAQVVEARRGMFLTHL